MSMQLELRELANIKIKLDIIGQLYDEKSEVIKKRLIAEKQSSAVDPNGTLMVNLVPSTRRKFSIKGVREVLGERAVICIEETINIKKFDSITRQGKEYVIDKAQQAKCFTTDTINSLTWDGLDVYRNDLIKAVAGDKDAGHNQATGPKRQ